MRDVILYTDDEGLWVAECPSLPGCTASGDERDHALYNIREAIAGYVAALEANGLPVPAEEPDSDEDEEEYDTDHDTDEEEHRADNKPEQA